MGAHSFGRKQVWVPVDPASRPSQQEMQANLAKELHATRKAGTETINKDYSALRKEAAKQELQPTRRSSIRDHKGHAFHSYEELCDYWGIDINRYKSLLLQGRTVAEALEASNGGKWATNAEEASKIFGVNEATANAVLKETHGHSFQSSYDRYKSFCEDHKLQKGVYLVRYFQIDAIGNIFPNSIEFATYYNMYPSEVRKISTIRQYSQGRGKTKMNLNKVLEPVNNPAECNFTFKGKQFRNFDCACVYFKHDPNAVRLRMAKGEKLESILAGADPNISKRVIVPFGDWRWVFLNGSEDMLRFFKITPSDIEKVMQETLTNGKHRTRKEAERVAAARKAKDYAKIEDERAAKSKREKRTRDKEKMEEEEEIQRALEDAEAKKEQEPAIFIIRGDKIIEHKGLTDAEVQHFETKAAQTNEAELQDSQAEADQAAEENDSISQESKTAAHTYINSHFKEMLEKRQKNVVYSSEQLSADGTKTPQNSMQAAFAAVMDKKKK